MNRRHFLGQVVLGSAAVSTLNASEIAAQAPPALRVKFVGMMGYISRNDASILVALPGQHPSGHYRHVPFLMARSGSAIALALQMTPMLGVQPAAFDDRLADAPAGSFAYRCLDGTDIDIETVAGGSIANRATQLAQMYKIAPGKRLRNDLRRWATSTVTLRGGALDNSAAHPDAGKTWSFGTHQQPLTDATMFTTSAAVIRLAVGASVLTYAATDAQPADLWIVSSAGPRTDVPDPKRLEHGALLFAYFDDADPVVATCAEAEGRITLATDLPCAPGSASRHTGAIHTAPPYVELCYGGGWCEPCI